MRQIIIAALAVVVVLGGCKDRAGQTAARASATATGVVDPTVTLSADKTSVALNETAQWTSVVAVPATETQGATGVMWRFQLPARFTFVAASEMIGVASVVITMGTPAGVATSYVTISWPTALSITPDAQRLLTWQIGDMAVGASRTIVVALKYTG